MTDRNVDSDGVVYVNAGEYIDTRVNAPKLRYHKAEGILLRIYRRTEIGSVGEQGTDQKADGHSCEQERAEPVIIIPVVEEKIYNRCAHIEEPQQIRYDKILAERDQIIQRRADHMVGLSDIFLKSGKPWQINETIGHEPDMPVFFY